MDIRTAEDKTAMLEALLNDARIEANHLRVRVERYRRIVASTRLVMGHELRKPAVAIAGYLDLAREDAERAGCTEAVTYIEKARAECELLEELNAFYLDLLKVDGATGEPRVDTVDVAELIEEAIEQTHGALRANTRVRLAVPDEVPPLSLNRNALKLIVLNLLENALSYSPEQRIVRVEVEAARDLRGTGDGEILRLRVVDEGNGIAPEDQKRVFQPFVRLDADNPRGVGLGLTLVRNLVDMCDGEVSIRSEQGKGTTVLVTLPVARRGAASGVARP